MWRQGTSLPDLYGYGVVILRLTIKNGVLIFKAFSRTWYNNVNTRGP